MSSDEFEPIEWAGAPKLLPKKEEASVVNVVTKKEGQTMRSSKLDETLATTEFPEGQRARMVKLVFRLESGGVVTDYVMLEGKGGRSGERKLKALGIDKGQPFVPNDLIGRRVTLDLQVETFNGEESLKPKSYIAIAGGDVPPSKPTPGDGFVPF